jgi:hypothetical protein
MTLPFMVNQVATHRSNLRRGVGTVHAKRKARQQGKQSHNETAAKNTSFGECNLFFSLLFFT